MKKISFGPTMVSESKKQVPPLTTAQPIKSLLKKSKYDINNSTFQSDLNFAGMKNSNKTGFSVPNKEPVYTDKQH